MLILSRKMHETIIIGDDIKIKVLGMDGLRVCLGIHAPKAISVHREEVYTRIKTMMNKIKIAFKGTE